MITIEALSQRDAKTLKDIRLRALQDTPSAFSSTYDKESRLSDAEWMERATRWSRDRSVAYLAMDGTVACGIVAAFRDEQDEAHAYLFRCGWHRRIAEPGSAQRWYIKYSNGRALKMSA
jgi:hypothetical protein